MTNQIRTADWIWCNTSPKKDEYGEFVDAFTYTSGNVILQISSDSNYATYVNGHLAAWGQYADFSYDKVYDEVDVTSYCKKGENHIAILVWYYGMDTIFTYHPGRAGLLFTLTCNDQVLCKSGTHTLSRQSKTYINHRMHIITPQLGLGYGYDLTKEDNWMNGELVDFTPSIKVEKNPPLRPRPCDKLTFLSESVGKVCKRISDTDIIFDLGSEQVGFLTFQMVSPCEQDITISYGEHLEDGCVRRIIGVRDFSAFFKVKKGENSFFNPFRRFGCRYLEVQAEYPVEVRDIGIVPTMYLLEEKERPILSEKQNKIYDMCVETLHLCMHEHYEDCPWREQSLYAMDSRNQMLCGYYAFHEFRFPRANLQLISKDDRKDRLLSICYPMKLDYVIPSFSLHYITGCREYLQYSGDIEFLREIYPKLVSIIEAFTSRIINGLVPPFEGSNYWNFYEWRDGLDGSTEQKHPDLLLNALLSIALQNLASISAQLGIENHYQKQADEMNAAIYTTFWDAQKGICYNFCDDTTYSQLGNALAILCGAVTGQEAVSLCELLLSDRNMTPISLSMQCFKYDALLKINQDHYAPIILKDIEDIYTPMIEFGSMTVWETELGEKDFDNAGSLCHGWSALPIYYYHILAK